jgi:hypothetical protein
MAGMDGIAGNGWKWQKLFELVGSSWKRLEIAGNDSK